MNGGGRAQLAVTIDVEPDREWEAEASRSLSNLGRLGRLHEVLREAGARPTYLVAYSVCADERGAEMLGELLQEGGCEIGAHLHPWDTPPLSPSDREAGPKPFPTELSEAELQAKLHTLTETLVGRVGVRPRSYRAGRWGLDGRGLRALEAEGYLADCSVTPLVSWERQRGRRAGSRGPNYRLAPQGPYYPDRQEVWQPGEGQKASAVLEVPVSVGLLGCMSGQRRAWYERMPEGSTVLRGLRKSGLLRPVWFRPTFSSARQMVALGERLLAEGIPALNMAFHSSEVLPGGSPYVRDEAGAAAFLARVKTTLAHFLARGDVEPATLTEVRAPAAVQGAVA